MSSYVTLNQKKLLVKYIKLYQASFFVLSLKQKPFSVFGVIELFLNNLLVQLYVVEFLRWDAIPRMFFTANCTWKSDIRIKVLSSLKHFKTKKALLLKKMFVFKVNKKKQEWTASFVKNLFIQQLFALILKARVISKTDHSEFKLKKNRILNKVASDSINSLRYTISTASKWFKDCFFLYITLNTCYYCFMYYDLLSKHIFIPLKYEFLLKDWLVIELLKYKLGQIYENDLKTFIAGTIYSFAKGFFLNEIYKLMCCHALTFKKIATNNSLIMFFKCQWHCYTFKKWFMYWELLWDANGFLGLSNSRNFLNIIKKKINRLLGLRYLQVQTNKIKRFKFHAFFNFPEWIFIFGIKSLQPPRDYFTKKFQLKPSLFSRLFIMSVNKLKLFLFFNLSANQNYSAYRLILILNLFFKRGF